MVSPCNLVRLLRGMLVATVSVVKTLLQNRDVSVRHAFAVRECERKLQQSRVR
jgi:hypothetical protein